MLIGIIGLYVHCSLCSGFAPHCVLIVYSWRLNYEIHWGEHVTGAFRAIHCLLYDYINGKDGFQIGIRYNKNIVH